MTQCERIKAYIEEHGSITAQEAMVELGVYRLAARISDLAEENYHTTRVMVKGKNRFGETVHFMRYSKCKL